MTTAWDDLAAENAWLRKEMEAMSQDILKVQCELAEFQIEYGTPAAMKEYVSGLEQALAEAKEQGRLEERADCMATCNAELIELRDIHYDRAIKAEKDRDEAHAAIRAFKKDHDEESQYVAAGEICECEICKKHAAVIRRAMGEK